MVKYHAIQGEQAKVSILPKFYIKIFLDNLELGYKLKFWLKKSK